MHFLLVGVALVALDRARGRERAAGAIEACAPAPSSAAPLSSGALRARVSEAFAEASGRPLGAHELGPAVEAWLDDEALLREGLRLGLDRDDPKIRQRVVAKARAVLLAQVVLPEATEAELKAHHAAHPERWEKPALVDFVQVFLKGDDDATRAQAGELLARLRGGADPAGLGDPFPGGRRYRRRPLAELAEAFGPAFVEGMASAPEGQWMLRPSRFGLHLVRIERRSEAERPTFAEARVDVAADLHGERREAALAASLRALRARHGVAARP